MIADSQGDPINVDLEKASSKDFEIRTMADDLDKGLSMKTSEPAKVASAPVAPVSIKASPSPLSSPPKPSGMPNITPEMLFDEEPQGGWLKSFLVGFLFVIIVGVIGVGGWWWYTSQSTVNVTPPTTLPTAPTTPPVLPVSERSLIPVDKTLTLEISDNDKQESFFTKLSSLLVTSKEGLAQGQVIRVVIKKGGKEVTLGDLGVLAGVDLNAYIKDSNTYNLVFGVPESAPILGLIVSLKDIQAIKNTLLAKEKDLPSVVNAIYNLYTKQSLPQGASKTFLDNIYQGVTIRYLNFDSPSRTLDYAFYNGTLLVAGSREMIFNLIDRAKASDLLGGKKGTAPSDTTDNPTTP